MSGKRLLIIGAGATGRGQVSQLAFESGWQISLVDRDAALIRALRASGKYTVRLYSPNGTRRDVVVAGYTTLHTGAVQAVADEVVRADLIITSVIATNLPAIAPLLAAGLSRREERRPGEIVNVIAAENMEHSSTVLRRHVLEKLPGWTPERLDAVARFPDSMIARVVPIPSDPLLLHAEEFSEWTTDGKVYVGPDPEIPTLELVPNQDARLQRKLFIHNTGHATCAYWALRQGYRYVHEGARDERIRREVEAAIEESGAAVGAEHGFSPQVIAAYRQNLMERLPGDAFVDGLDRVCREPIRKISPHERLIGPIELCAEHSLPMDHLCRAVAVVLCGDMPGDEQYARLQRMLREGGGEKTEKVLAEVCGLALSHPAYAKIANEYIQLRNSR